MKNDEYFLNPQECQNVPNNSYPDFPGLLEEIFIVCFLIQVNNTWTTDTCKPFRVSNYGCHLRWSVAVRILNNTTRCSEERERNVNNYCSIGIKYTQF